jgi:hypothetical protein
MLMARIGFQGNGFDAIGKALVEMGRSWLEIGGVCDR